VIDQACADISDPAEAFAVSLRISGRLGWTHPDIARFLTGVGLESLDSSRGLALRALRDIQVGQAAGCEAARPVASGLPPVGAVSR
jgi:hypothetical protein